MRLTNVALYSDSPFGIGTEVINFSLEHTHGESQYLVRAITGLDAEEIIPKFYGFSKVSKQRYYSMGLRAREIVMRIVLNPRFEIDESYSDIRDELYRAISATRTGVVVLHFNSGPDVVARIPGFITKFEVGYFNQLPEVQITVRCDDPMFRGITPVVLEADEVGSAASSLIQVGDSISTAPHGFSFEMTLGDDHPGDGIYISDKEIDPEWYFRVSTSGTDLLPGDVIHFSSEFNNKQLFRDRSGVILHLMDKIEPQSIWPIIFPGFNTFFIDDYGTPDIYVLDKVEYYPAYWGI